jgi:hypothetical protein
MEQRHAQPGIASSTPLPVSAILAGIGGLVALIGVFLDWANVTSSFAGGQFAGQQLPEISETVSTVRGLSHWTGLLALVAGIATVGAAIAIVLLHDPATRRMATVVALGGGGLAFLLALLGFFMSEAIVVGGDPEGRLALEFQRQFAERFGGQGFSVDTGPAIGVFVTAVGGAVAAAGGLMGLGRAGPQAGRAEPLPGTGFEPPPPPPGDLPEQPARG